MEFRELREKFMGELHAIFNVQSGTLTESTRFRDDLNAASFHYFGMVSIYEELTGKTVTFMDAKSCESIADAIKLLESLTN